MIGRLRDEIIAFDVIVVPPAGFDALGPRDQGERGFAVMRARADFAQWLRRGEQP